VCNKVYFFFCCCDSLADDIAVNVVVVVVVGRCGIYTFVVFFCYNEKILDLSKGERKRDRAKE